MILFLVGNKKDMEEQREVSLDRVEKFKRDRNIMFHFETSAKTGENIENLFIFASKVLYNSFKDKIEQMVSVHFLFFSLSFSCRSKIRSIRKRTRVVVRS